MIDTKDKRASCYCLALPFGRVSFTPDGSIGQQDRAQLNFLYRGIPGTPGPSGTAPFRWEAMSSYVPGFKIGQIKD